MILIRLSFATLAASALLATPAHAVLVYQHGSGDTFADAPIVVARNDGTHPRVVAHGFAPQVSATGRRLTYFVLHGRDALYEVGVDGTHRRRLTLHVMPAGPRLGVAWSPDDRYVITQSDEFGVRLVDRQRRKASSRGPGGYGGASFAPDGARYAVGSGGLDSAVVIDSVEQQEPLSVWDGFRPVWGRPGVAFGREHRVLLRHRMGGRARTLLTEPFPDLSPVDWSANGHRLIVYESPSRKPSRAAVIGLESKRVTRIPVPVSSVTGISNDGHDVLAEQDGDVVLLRLNGTRRVLVPNATFATWTK
jgi:hypothetical protein